MDNNFDIEVVAEVEVDVENEVDIEVEVEQAGPRGKVGLSAYDIYVKNGGILTEEEWLISLKGEPGKDGDKGEKGEKGDIGDTGYTLKNTLKGESITIEDAVEYKLFNLEIDGKSVQNGDTGEIESVGYKNLFDTNRFLANTGIDSNGTIVTLDQNNLYYMPIKYGEKYIMSFDNTIASGNIIYGFCDEIPTIGSKCTYNVLTIDKLNKNIFSPISVSNKYLCIRLNYFNQIPYMSNVSLIEGENVYAYGKTVIKVKVTNGTDINTTILYLNEPLRSLPNGVKDKAYIKNNKLYVDRYVGSIVLNGSESWSGGGSGTTSTNYTYVHSNVIDGKVSEGNFDAFCDKLNVLNNVMLIDTNVTTDTISCANYGGQSIRVMIETSKLETQSVDGFKNWLSNNNVEVVYKLAKPVTEEVGDCIIYTYEGINNIALEAGLKTEFSVTYAQDMKSILKDYPSMEEMQEYVDSQLGTINEQLASLTEVE